MAAGTGRRRHALRWGDKLFLCLAGVILATAAIVHFAAERAAESTARREREVLNQRVLGVAVTMLEERMSQGALQLQMALDSAGSQDRLDAFISRVNQVLPQVRALVLVDAQGEVLARFDRSGGEWTPSEKPAGPRLGWYVQDGQLVAMHSLMLRQSGQWFYVHSLWDNAHLLDITGYVQHDSAQSFVFFDAEQNMLALRESQADEQALEQRLYLQYPNTSGTFSVAGKAYGYSVSDESASGWRVLLIEPDGAVGQVRAVRATTIIVTAVMLLLAILLARGLSANMTDNMRLLLMSMKKFSADINYKPLQPLTHDEVGELAQRFNEMAEKIQALVASNYQARIDRQRAELRTLQFEYKALQAQMDPHFLYNTLENIHALAELSGQAQISELTFLLGKLLRESIGRKGDFGTLREELAFCDGYLAIQKIVYQDHLQLFYAIDPETESLYVPKFILQPIVENAIKHGIEEKPGGGVVLIEAHVREHELLLSVMDNGVGMSQERIDALLDSAEQRRERSGASRHTRVGVYSVHRRVFMLYGEPHGIRVQSREGLGTRMTIALPLLTGQHVYSADEAPEATIQ